MKIKNHNINCCVEICGPRYNPIMYGKSAYYISCTKTAGQCERIMKLKFDEDIRIKKEKIRKITLAKKVELC